MTKFKIVYDRPGCIGAGSCVTQDPERWQMDFADNKAVLKNGVKNTETEMLELELEGDQSTLDKLLKGAQACPVIVIHVYNKDTGEKVYP